MPMYDELQMGHRRLKPEAVASKRRSGGAARITENGEQEVFGPDVFVVPYPTLGACLIQQSLLTRGQQECNLSWSRSPARL